MADACFFTILTFIMLIIAWFGYVFFYKLGDKVCEYCGGIVPLEDDVCPHCGASIKEKLV